MTAQQVDLTDGEREHQRLVLRNRLLHYLDGMDLGSAPAMEMATEIIRSIGPEGTMEQAFDLMRQRLHEQGFDFPLASTPDKQLRSFPPFNRKPMLAAPVERLSLLDLLGKFASGLFSVLTLRHILWDRQ